MRRVYAFIFSSAVSVLALAQEAVPDTTIVESRKLIRAAAYLDYGKIITRLANYEDKLEGALSLLFLENYELTGEIGRATLAPDESYTNGNYSASGNYMRFGAGYMGNFKSDFVIGLGVRYGISQFEDQGLIEIVGESSIENRYSRRFDRPDLEARWWEAVVTSEKKIRINKDNTSAWYNDLFAIGFNMRLRFLVTYDQDSPIDVYSIPGYGKSIDRTTPVLNLFVKIYLF